MKRILMTLVFLLELIYHIVMYTLVCIWKFKIVKWSVYITGHYKVSGDDSHVIQTLENETFWNSIKRWFNWNYYFE